MKATAEMRCAACSCEKRRHSIRLIAGAIVANFAFAPAYSQNTTSVEVAQLTQLSIEQLLDIPVYSVSKRMQRASDAPSSVTVLTAEDFKTYGWRTLADALRSARGFFVSYDRLNHYLGVRGFQRPSDFNSRILLLIDGYRTNDNISDGALIGSAFPLDAELIERVEIVRGPGSSIYGGNALFAVVNVITRSGARPGNGEISASAASFDSYQGRVTVQHATEDGTRTLLSASRYESDGPTLSFPGEPSSGGAPVSGTDYEERLRFFGKIEHQGLRLSAAHAYRNKGITGGLFGTRVDPTNHQEDTRSFVDASFTRTVGEAETSARLAYGEHQRRAIHVHTPPSLSHDESEGAWWVTEIKAVATVANGHSLVVGAEYQDNFTQDQTHFHSNPFALHFADSRSSERVGVYVQDDFAVLDNFSLSAGVRYDGYSGDDHAINPRLGVILRQSETTVWKLLYGTAFRPPNAREKYYSHPAKNSANPALQPEELKSYEAILETAPRTDLKLTAVAYHYRIENLINIAPDPADPTLNQFQNLDKAKASGAEFEVEYALNKDARMRASYTWQQTKDGESQRLSNSPKQQAKLNASSAIWNRTLRAALEVQYLDSRRVGLGIIPAYTLTNLTVSTLRPLSGWDLSASVYNLFDRAYFDPADLGVATGREALEQDGRTWQLTATYRF